MGLPNRARGSFKHLEFPKKGTEIIDAATKQRVLVHDKIDEREQRIKDLCDTKGLKVADFFTNAEQFYANATSALGIQSGELAQLQEESRQISSEKKVIQELSIIIDNLPADETFKLDFSELEYFGF
jgi:hypothetical protein